MDFSWQLFRAAGEKWSDHNAPRLGAALAYYAILSLAPFVILMVVLAGQLFGPDAVRGQLFWQIRSVAGDQSAALVQSVLKDAALHGKSGIVAGIAGFIMLLAGASGIFIELENDLNYIWGAGNSRRSFWRAALAQRLRMVFMVIGAGLLVILSIAGSFVIQAGAKYASAYMSWPPFILEAANFTITFAGIAFLFALIYRTFPSVPLAWRDVTAGAVVTAALFVIGKSLVGLYLARAAVGSTYGAAGSIVVVSAWVYYSSQIFLYGAEFTKAYAERHRTILRHA
jgi:membrane protein